MATQPTAIYPDYSDPIVSGARSATLSARAARRVLGCRLHVILFAALVIISAVPVFLLSAWVQSSAMEKEIGAVTDKHLQIAKNLSGALSRYVNDVSEGFRFAVGEENAGRGSPNIDRLLRSLSFHQVDIIDAGDRVVGSLMAPTPGIEPIRPSAETLNLLRAIASVENGDVTFSDLMRENETPVFFVVLSLDNDRFAVGALGTDYIRRVQRAVAFGERGHSMIVDAKGQVVAHPNAQWEAISKNASKLSVVQAMMRGETGVATFYSPPMQADMIAGHTFVPRVRWGVMVPQPMSELEDQAGDVQHFALTLTLIGILIAAFLAWWLAKFLAKPIVAVEEAAGAVAAGGLHTQVPSLPAHAPREMRSLSASFNDMVNELRRREEGLRFAINEAEAANRAKTEFLANMSHELRTPLNAVIGFAHIMRDEKLGPLGSKRYRDYAGDILDSGNHLLDVINDVLDMSKIEAGELKPAKTDFALADVVTSCVRMVGEHAVKGGTAVSVDLAHDLPLMRADKRMVGQIILNLLSNAIKFTPEGGQVHLTAAVDDRGGLTIAVADTGIGISPEHVGLVLQPFCQVDTTLQRRHDGTGLGLPLVNSMARLHGATLHIDSKLDCGTTVTVRFPLDAVQRGGAAA